MNRIHAVPGLGFRGHRKDFHVGMVNQYSYKLAGCGAFTAEYSNFYHIAKVIVVKPKAIAE